ncbi:YjcZ family sporulation protein [Bacillus swezeyi]|uniref:YjcZ family sporulation protein n=1 Tax=Bacillus swezeyi TaxID=1925020 RepID=UPI001239AE7B|nr:YjcZ family sporulation protein [Bacillus swezeyi]KAA6481922.1 YjcZ family sporulation protein [Bacillus swezeyi]
MGFGYGGYGGFGGFGRCCGGYGGAGYGGYGYGGVGYGGGFALIVVLFILLIIIGACYVC